ncbi:MAG: RNA polymerase sigma factor, partial [Solirubrobacteraceae bacterium]
MDELHEFCARMLGDREAAARVAQGARQAGGSDRLGQLARAVKACRTGSEDLAAASDAVPSTGGGLAAAVASELASASARLPQRQREALALRELLGLSHQQLADVIGVDPAAVAPLLARSRLRLRAELRGGAVDVGDCPERERTLRTVTLRQDSEPVAPADDDWLVEHLGHCDGCGRA